MSVRWIITYILLPLILQDEEKNNMKKFIVIFLGLLLIGCTKPEEVSMNKSLSEFVGTRAEAPLESTI
jgi:hypothetical protein